MYILTFLLSLPLFIKNNDLPCCVNCIHFIENKNNYPYDPVPDNNLGKCKLFGVKNIITCENNNEFASVCREDKDKCGMGGKYFHPKDKFELISSFTPSLPVEKIETSTLLEKV